MKAGGKFAQFFCTLIQLFQFSQTRAVFTEVQEQRRNSGVGVVNYLVQYGYLQDQEESTPEHDGIFQGYSKAQVSQALQSFQKQFKLPQTGTLDLDTIEVLNSPRCGVRDRGFPYPLDRQVITRGHRRRKRFVTIGSKWDKLRLTYHIDKWSSKLANEKVNETITKAFRLWAEVCPLTFRWTSESSDADIVIKFLQGYHGDKQAFDGPGKILAHAFYPSFGGDVHLDDSETWATEYRPEAKNLLRILTHEIGHSLGLDHTNFKSAVMNPLYRRHINKRWSFRLHHDDISGIQSIYGECETSISSIFSWMKNGRSYIFKDNNYWRIYDWGNRSDFGYPRVIDQEWKNIPPNIDEAFLWSYNWRTYFFKGDSYYRYSDERDGVDPGYPRKIRDGWPGIPNNIDAAFSAADHRSYFFKDHLVYAFDNENDRVAEGFPKNISVVWPGVPNKIDTVFRYYFDAVTYFFKGLSYWTWDDKRGVANGPMRVKDRWKNLCFV